jgi:hypothetical protein
MIVFVLFDFSLGAFLYFPAFALIATVCSILYSFCIFNKTAIGYVVNYLSTGCASTRLFFFRLTMLLYRRFQLFLRNDQYFPLSPIKLSDLKHFVEVHLLTNVSTPLSRQMTAISVNQHVVHCTATALITAYSIFEPNHLIHLLYFS